MKAKKFLGFLTTAVLTLGLMTGCGSQETKSTTTQASSEITEAATTAAATETEEPTQTSAGEQQMVRQVRHWLFIIQQAEEQRPLQRRSQRLQGQICLRSFRMSHIRAKILTGRTMTAVYQENMTTRV